MNVDVLSIYLGFELLFVFILFLQMIELVAPILTVNEFYLVRNFVTSCLCLM